MSTAIIKPEWSFVTIALMVGGFILFWPLGLAMLAYILWGENFGGSAEKAQSWVKNQKKRAKGCRSHYRGRHHHRHSSGNAAFDDYREEQMKRLDEERQRLDAEIGEFQEYMYNLDKARDRKEFDRFMRDRSEARADKKDSKKDSRED